ncbi:hypothetical protein PEC302110_21310 [Pectobacterium araliae]|uniref:Uncharacterized protein n=1 Tax=Pectobacterium araliae TaxID=3073862 RepID=A0AAN0KAU5_9GAMM|nr:hypothetical protein PEC302110_21310 [Pectobacterium sp. MAFF 302110]
MSKRYEILDGSKAAASKGGLVYTEVLGWIDLGHAQGTDIRNLLSKINQGEESGQERYNVTYSQSMRTLTASFALGNLLPGESKKGVRNMRDSALRWQ